MAEAVWATSRDAPRARALAEEALTLLANEVYAARRAKIAAWLAKLLAG